MPSSFCQDRFFDVICCDMKEYNHSSIEKKWQKEWQKKKIFQAKDSSKKKKYYVLMEFPYPSGDGLHTGHVRGYTAMDIVSRKRRMEGFNVLYPIGWDAFGLPTENYAIKTGVAPEKVTKKNTDNFRRQFKNLGMSLDWSREVNTTDPKYYKWTQWIFLQMWKCGLAYKKKMSINWCPKDKIGLANEEVVNGKCERCGSDVEKREKEQWMLAITKYADRLDKDLDRVDFLEKIKLQQRNWIGRSEGAELGFRIESVGDKGEKKDLGEVKVFTTRPDTLFGVTYLVVAPENPLVQNWRAEIKNWQEAEKYIEQTKKTAQIDRTNDEREKTGVRLDGISVINPVNSESVPVFIADYVLADYGTGAVMAVPAHDDRDFAFAKKYNLPIKQVILGDITTGAFIGDGVLINSGKFDGLTIEEVKKKITEFAGGKMVETFKLRDWVFSRQRYWGEPIPLVKCEKCGLVPLSEKDLPLKLPKVKKYQPTDTGESPLAIIDKWVNTKCPKCGGKARRETDTMPQWAGSSWYWLRYIDPKNSKKFADPKKLKHWSPVDWYNGGMEHTTLHLLYSRFWHKFLYDIGVVPTDEPFKKRTSHGMILAEGGEKMSKSRGNVVNPDEIVKTFGADTLRVYEMFMGPFDQAIAWDTNSISGSRRFLERVWRLQNKVSKKVEKSADDKKIEILLNKTVQKVSDGIEAMRFNTAISATMILLGEFEKAEKISRKDFEVFLKILSPFAPHICEEIWRNIGNKTLLATERWPKADTSKMQTEKVIVVIQINGKVRAQLSIGRGMSQDELVSLVQKMPDVDKWLSGKKVVKIIHIPDRLLNFVVAL